MSALKWSNNVSGGLLGLLVVRYKPQTGNNPRVRANGIFNPRIFFEQIPPKDGAVNFLVRLICTFTAGKALLMTHLQTTPLSLFFICCLCREYLRSIKAAAQERPACLTQEAAELSSDCLSLGIFFCLHHKSDSNNPQSVGSHYKYDFFQTFLHPYKILI